MARQRPFSGFEWLVAGRYLRAKRAEGIISVITGFSLIGIMIGVAALIIVMSVMNGLREELLTRILGVRGHLVVQSEVGAIPDYDAVAQRIRAISGVISATPIMEGQVLVNANGASFGEKVRGIKEEDLRKLTTISSTLSDGALERFDEGDSVIIGQRLADRLGLALAPEMTVTLVAPRGAVTPFGATPRTKTYRIAGTFHVDRSEYDTTYIFMPLSEAQQFFGIQDTVGEIEIMVAAPERVEALRGPILNAAGPMARVMDWKEMNSSLYGALNVERDVMFLVLTLIVLVAALNIISGLIMLVKDKSGDIAILRTMGATQSSVMRVFFIAGASIGTIGTFAGLLIGVVFCSNIENIRQFLLRFSGTALFDPTIDFLSQMPAKVDPYEVLAVVLMSLGLSFLATVYPSWRAARLDPVEALRYE